MILPHLLAAAALSAAAPEIPRFEVGPCAQPAVPRAQCGTVDLPENRAAPGGRRIALHVMVIKPDGAPRLPPLFDIDGGPGLPSSKNAGFYASNGISKGRDVVMIDQRGTGRSNALLCAELQTGPTEPMLPPEAVERCRDALSPKADLRFYGTRDAVSDLEAVRQALGYGQIDLFGMSYGTTVALRYMRRYPDKVRAAILMGTSPPDFLPPQHHATAAERALEQVRGDCEADPECRKAFPGLRADLAKARAMAGRRGSPINDELLMERLRALMYAPGSRARLPLMVRQAAAGDFKALLAKPAETGASMIADGMFLAITCGESFPLMNFEAAVTAARRTRFGDYRLRRQKAACADWPLVERDADHLLLPTGSSAAVLLVSGELDPVTPPDYAETVKLRLPRARHIIVPDGGHIPDGVSGLETCLDPVMIDFLDHADLQRLNLACVAAMKGPGFTLR